MKQLARVSEMGKKIGEALALLRRRKGYGQADLAVAAGWSQPTLSRLEKGRNITVEKLAVLAKLLGTQPSEILKLAERL